MNNEERSMLDDNSSLSQSQWDEIVQIWENYQLTSNLEVTSTNIRSQALDFLTKKNKKLTRSDIRRFQAKISKIKNSQNREAKFNDDKLLKKLQQIINE